MKIFYDRGIIVKEGNYKIMLDPEYAKTPIGIKTIVTHAHTDHTQVVSGSSTTYLTPETLDLYKVSHTRRPRDTVEIKMNEPFELGPFEIELVPAGHLLGAAQIIVRKGNIGFQYTGDFCLEELLTVGPAFVPKDIDLIALDATYGSKRLHFPPRENVRNQILTWVVKVIGKKKIPVINVAQMGGAQEVITYLNKMFPNMPILTHPIITAINRVFEKYGQKLLYEDLNEQNLLKNFDGKFIILVPRSFKKIDNFLPGITKNSIEKCIVTGQSAKFSFSKFDFAIPLSTHASYPEIIEMVTSTNPLHVLTNFGYHKDLAKEITDEKEIPCKAESIKNSDMIDLNLLKGNKPTIVAERLDDWF